MILFVLALALSLWPEVELRTDIDGNPLGLST